MFERRIEVELFKVDSETGCLATEIVAFLVSYTIEGTYYAGSVFEPAEYPEVEVDKIVNEATKEEVPFDLVFFERRTEPKDRRYSFADFCNLALNEWEKETGNDRDDEYYDDY